jgi:hypothetical protein
LPLSFDSHALNCPKPVTHAHVREAKFVEYNESPDPPQSNRRAGWKIQVAPEQMSSHF